MRLISTILAALVLLAATGTARSADGPFDPKVFVNGSAISNYEFEQRVLLLTALNAPGDLEKQSMDALIDDRLRLQAAKLINVQPDEVAISRGMQEFASRNNLTVQQLLQALGQKGVEPETYRDFVRAAIAWREVVRARFASQARVSDAEVDRALSVTSLRGSARVLLSELIIPAQQGQQADALAMIQELGASIHNEAEFAAAARQYSASGTAAMGGQVDWIDIGKLPPGLRETLLTMSPGQITRVVPIPNAYALFLLRGVQESSAPPQVAIDVDYVQVLLPEGPTGQALVSTLVNKADTCADVVRLANSLPPQQVIHTVQGAGEVPKDIAFELAKLDTFETSYSLRRGGSRVFLMLCGRTMAPVDGADAMGTADVQEAPDANAPGPKTPPATLTREEKVAKQRDQIRTQMLNDRILALGAQYLAQLRSQAIIREP